MRKYKTVMSSHRKLVAVTGGSIILLVMLFIGIIVNSIINYLDTWPTGNPLLSELINPTTIMILSAALGALLGGIFTGRIIKQKAIFYGLLSILLILIIELSTNYPQEMFIMVGHNTIWPSFHFAFFEKTHGYYVTPISWFLELICGPIGAFIGERL
ncbi:MAG: hypothetical protein COW32_00955 [Candidatus Aquicultor secundus]|uniref:Uncharacterized protein n=1 Tax=Candidatus Aquicultor secundus TaxID=1973895 RepID=A0A2M7T8K7_9ACTN|nr:hypothetical protein [Candidatus Aquicultor secundus]NCS68119.1 hypothetical protein [Candidatus Peregrinibacteria bacterium]PIU26998.1 MAG: hypothetical protein COT10_05775 [Candidatus Aquicultor secundus]PIW23129.1 MAG: hypothetical protein COW32_00955 [Candidatus Aquicultor secundus]PIY38243.1 MAG: hypothetical protein COZ03_08620 [Candidatus Aquicultor secundus]PIZ39961.1 MAG: hypothetical protein COY37_04480 [Candidatus Aquicultor secundus]